METTPLPSGLTAPQRDALAAEGINDGAELVGWVATQLVEMMRRHNDKVRPTAAKAEAWLADLLVPEPPEQLDPDVLNGWETAASFTTYFLHRPNDRDRQILVVRNEHEDEEATRPGWDGDWLGPWMQDQLADLAPGTTTPPIPTAQPQERAAMAPHRNYDGTNNGARSRNNGAVGRPLLDLGLEPVAFDPQGGPNPRRVSTKICRGPGVDDPHGRSAFMWVWGQFLDHELDLIVTPENDPESADMVVPDDDPRIEFRGSTMSFVRSARDDAGGLPNLHTAYVDASNVYGTSDDEATSLRTMQDGLLRADGPPGAELLPAAADGFGFAAGDRRVNEHSALIAMHTVWLREHNRLCRVLADQLGVEGDDKIYQRARALVGGQMQVITYEEFVPALLGPDALPPWLGFRPEVDPGISNLFATAAYRLGHSMVGPDLDLGPGSQPLPLRDAFFVPDLISYAGIEPFLQGLAHQPMLAIDGVVVDGLREHLFAVPGPGRPPRTELRDLAVLNIQRGRDHELPGYNHVRAHFGLPTVDDFRLITTDRERADALAELYGSPDTCDVWIGALAEEPRGGRPIGDLLAAILADQFQRLRDGDFHWWQCDPNLTESDRRWVGERRLADVLRNNTSGFNDPEGVFPTDLFHC